MPLSRRHRRALLVACLLAGGAILAAAVAWHVASRAALAREGDAAARQLALYGQTLQQRIDRFRVVPQVLALDPDLRRALLDPGDAVLQRAMDHKLERADAATGASTLTLVDRRGIALAASNWRLPSSNVGEDYAFRPYVIQGLREGHGRFYGIGMTTGEAGYFLSEAVRGDDGAILGLVVVKIELASLERDWRQGADIVLVGDRHGIAFLASRDAWRYRALSPLSPRDRGELSATRQYASQRLRSVRVAAEGRAVAGGRVVRVRDPRMPHPLLWLSTPMPEEGWRLHLLHDVHAGTVAARNAAIAAAGGWLALGFLLLYVLQRRRVTRLKLHSRRELEALVEQHARELRSARDGLVEAAQDAEAGLSRSLAHLPQGVVVVDAAQRLVAWNARYAELFGFPDELLRVGQPIADLFRFNAQRGLLGPGPVEAAIERRLAHLRGGRPHQRESEKDDGTVLEIRGNPLPDGGFVTSYTDITAYTTAARELRSLADTLERRVQDRTRALAAAKREAEDASRYKTRFVAAAVHDLLQPLNAARMFLSTLRTRLAGDEARAVADHVAQALAAQDAILNSLLDISRLEAGTLPTQVRDFALDPLLHALAREFGALAARRGLRLVHVRCRVVVHSDAALLRRIVQNFLSNAIRYARGGRIVLGCRRVEGGVRIEVHDQGPGIPDSQQAAIFEEFRRLDDGVAGDRGAGLGLAIVDRIGRMLGHRVGLRSRVGHGSVFSIDVPCGHATAEAVDAGADAPRASGDAAEDSPLRGRRVWCVGDDADARDATCALLRRWECVVAFAGDDADALAAAQPGNAPALCLLDAGTNADAAAAIHARLCERWRAVPPMIVSAPAFDDAFRAKAREHRWGLLVAPPRPPALRALLAQLLLQRAD